MIKRLKGALVEAARMNAGGREVVARRSFLSIHSLSSTRFGNEGLEALPADGDALVNLELEFALEDEDQLDAYLAFSPLLDAGNQLLVTTRNDSGDRVLPATIFQNYRAPLQDLRTNSLHTKSP